MPSALITGGGTGIGLASAVALHAAGWTVTITGRRADVLAGAAREIGQHGVVTHVADLADPAAPAAAVAAHVAAHAGLDAFVHCAGAYEDAPLDALTATQWDATMDVHVRAAALGSAAAAKVLPRGGRVVLVSSVNGYHAEPLTIDYTTAKTAIIGMTRALAVDLAPAGVCVNAVAPGWVTTPMTFHHLEGRSMAAVNALGRPGRPEEIAHVIDYLVREAPEFLTGATVVVDGGQTALAPLPQ